MPGIDISIVHLYSIHLYSED